MCGLKEVGDRGPCRGGGFGIRYTAPLFTKRGSLGIDRLSKGTRRDVCAVYDQAWAAKGSRLYPHVVPGLDFAGLLVGVVRVLLRVWVQVLEPCVVQL